MKTYVPKQTVKVPSKSNFDGSSARVFPMRIGSLYPAYWRRIVPKTTAKFSPVINITSNPLVSDLKGTFRIHVETFFEPYNNLYGAFDNNHAVSSDMKLHTTKVSTGATDSTVAIRIPFVPRGGVLNYLYAPCLTKLYNPTTPTTPGMNLDLNLDPLLAYLDVVRSYYRCDQVGYCPYTSSGSESEETNGYIISDSLDKFFLRLRQNIVGINFASTSASAVFSGTDTSFSYPPTVSNPNVSQYFTTVLRAGIGESATGYDIGSGLFYRPMNRDIFSCQITKNSAGNITAPITSNALSINNLYSAMRIEEMAALNDYASGRISDFVANLYGMKGVGQSDRPRLVNVQSAYIDINTVRTTAATENQPAGSSIGSIVFENQFKDFHFSSHNEYGILLTVVSLSPIQVYSGGYQFTTLGVSNFDDLYNPSLDGLPPQTIPAWVLDASTPMTSTSSGTPALGRFPAFIEYTTDVNRSFDLFESGQSLDYWNTTFKPRLTFSVYSDTPNNFTSAVDPYIHPQDWTFMFADTAARSRNIYATLQMNANYRIPKSKQLQKLY